MGKNDKLHATHHAEGVVLDSGRLVEHLQLSTES